MLGGGKVEYYLLKPKCRADLDYAANNFETTR